jgi:hypothetical protein
MRKFSYYVIQSSNTIRKTEIRYTLDEKNNPEKKDYKRYMTNLFILCMPGESKSKEFN